MFKITITGIAEYMLKEVEKVGTIECIDQDRRAFTASFKECTFKARGDMVRIKNPKKHTVVYLLNYEFAEITIV